MPWPFLLIGAASASDIVITAERSPSRVLPPTVMLDDAALRERQPRTGAEAVAQLPGVSVRTNSRGEAIARIRASEERQALVFLDGAPLAVPWDGRADLGVIPAGLIGATRATKGAAPIEYGPNAVAGAIDLETRSGGSARVRASAGFGSLGQRDAAAIVTLPAAAGLDVTLGAAALSRDAERVADLDSVPFSQPDRRARINTDLRSLSGFAALAWTNGPLKLRGSLLHFDARRGIAPESDRDPAVDTPRYWRYPDIRLTQLNLSSRLELGQRASLRLTGWRQWFGQQIRQYRDSSYVAARMRQDDRDATLGGRLVLSAAADPLTLRLVASAQTSRHAQRDQPLPVTADAPTLVYRQNLYAIGAEADAPVAGGRMTVGAGLDFAANPRTGDKPAQDALAAPAFSAAWRRPLGAGWTLALSGGRRNRFPTAREMFGEALGRFLPNPGLRPEQAWLGDVELHYEDARLDARLNPFIARADDTIAQRIVEVGGKRLRQRYNLSGSLAYGVDAAVTARLGKRLRAEAGATLLSARADRGTAPFRALPQRPWLELEAALAFEPTDRLGLRAEVRHVGAAVDLDPAGKSARLPAGTVVNLRGRWRLAQPLLGGRLALTAGIDNLLDGVITPQLGLPEPGRSIRLGIALD